MTRMVGQGSRLSGWILLAALALVPALGANDETRSPWVRGVFTGGSPRPVSVAAYEAWSRAQALADESGDALVLLGTGRSMQPLYPSGTILVLKQVAYDQLQRGQTALYRSKSDRAVVHVLITKARDGWRAKGLNNSLHDLEPVVADNLLGVVVAAFVPRKPVALADLAARRTRIALFSAD